MARKSELSDSSDVDLLQGNKILSYPVGLGSLASDDDASAEHLTQFLMIRINTDEKATRLREDESTGPVQVADRARSGHGIEVGRSAKDTVTLEKTKNTDAMMTKKFGADAVGKEKWTTQRGMTKLNKVIILPMPNEHVVGTSIQYDTDYESSLLTKAGDVWNQLGSGAGAGMAAGAAAYGVSKFANAIKGMVTSRGKDTSTRDIAAAFGTALNPKKEVLYNGFGFREFSFRYQFAPKSETEAKMVRDIIETLRYYALPEIYMGKMFYIMPAEFELTFMRGQSENTNIPRIATSVLKRVSVNYSPMSVWATLPDGSPAAIDITLDFNEVELIDRTRIFNPDSPITSGY